MSSGTIFYDPPRDLSDLHELLSQKDKKSLNKRPANIGRQRSSNNDNRLAPYNPTHESAQEKALDLLNLQSSDVFFDLGCGDGRLLVAAMELYYDDDYLLAENFRRDAAIDQQKTKRQKNRFSKDSDKTGGHRRRESTVDFSDLSEQQADVPHLMRFSSGESQASMESSVMSTDDEEDHHFRRKNRYHFSHEEKPQMPVTPVICNRKSHGKTTGARLGKIHAVHELIPPLPPHDAVGRSDSDSDSCPGTNISQKLSYDAYDMDIPGIPTTITASFPQELGLRCVGIEYNQAYVEAARQNIEKSLHMYSPLVQSRICVKWGDVLDEWRRGEEDLLYNENEHNLNGECFEDEKPASRLTLLNDATAVFVYLLPEGLEKVKPLLLEAAKRRSQFGGQQSRNTSSSTQELIASKSSRSSYRKDCTFLAFSEFSDISELDYDFHLNVQGAYDDNDSHGDQHEYNDEGGTGFIPENQTSDYHPAPFRVVSYMFSIPGWRPTRVDKSSKVGFPLYLYENIETLTC